MVLIRIAHTADLPPPDEIIRALGGAPEARRQGARAAPAGTASAGATAASERVEAQAAKAAADLDSENPGDFDFSSDEGSGEPDEAGASETVPGQGGLQRTLAMFDDVVALAGEKRDAKLKVSLEEQVSLVRFDGAAGAIDLFLLPGAAAGLGNELREKLNKWTGRRWIVALSKTPGAPPIGQVRRERKAAEIASLKRHPAVAAVLEAFPDAEISDVRPLPGARTDDDAGDDSATG
jgi:DNA polymerase-3 subunit gamma/tau